MTAAAHEGVVDIRYDLQEHTCRATNARLAPNTYVSQGLIQYHSVTAVSWCDWTGRWHPEISIAKGNKVIVLEIELMPIMEWICALKGGNSVSGHMESHT